MRNRQSSRLNKNRPKEPRVFRLKEYLHTRLGKATVAALVVCGGLGMVYGLHHHENTKAETSVSTHYHIKHRNPLINLSTFNAVNNDSASNGIKKPKLKTAHSAIAMDADNGNVLYSKNADEPGKVASIAKLMTLYLVEQKMSEDPVTHGNSNWNEVVPVNERLRKMSYSTDDGGFKFKKHHLYTVRELFKAALVDSSNNSAIALGQWVAGNNARFVKLMNQQAQAWHLNAHFVSASGLENDDLIKYKYNLTPKKTDANSISAKSIAVIAYHLLNQYPSVLKYSKDRTITLDGQHLLNVDQLLPGGTRYTPKLHVDGLKTGFTPAAGMCFVGTEKPRNGHRIITVVLHESNGVNEFNDTRALMQYANKANRNSLN